MARQRIIVTGASGFIGRHLLDEIKERYTIFALARRSQAQCGAPEHPNIKWVQVDIGEPEPLRAAFRWICSQGPISAVVHLAAHYDFTGDDSPEYQRTNISGLRKLLEICRPLKLERFIFASSVAACPFPPKGEFVTETSQATADNPYARSKRIGEEMLTEEFAEEIRSCIVRFAAIYSDWCQYPPLFEFLNGWLSKGWNSRMIGGRGGFAIPFLHIRCAVSFLDILLRNLDCIDSGEVLVASPDGAVTQREIFDEATLAFYGARRHPTLVPKPITRVWLHIQDIAGKAVGKRPFERPWMGRYLDRKLVVDSSHTRERLGWTPRPRFGLLRRVPFLVENLRTQPVRWNELNHAAMKKEDSGHGLMIQWLLEKHQEEIIAFQVADLLDTKAQDRYGSYQQFSHDQMADLVRDCIRNLRRSIRTREMEPVGGHCRGLARERFEQGFSEEEVCEGLLNLGRICIERLQRERLAQGLKRSIPDRISMAIQFGIDEVQDEFEHLGSDGDPCAHLLTPS